LFFFRNLFALAILFPLLFLGGLQGFRTRIPAWHCLRAGAGLMGMYCFFYLTGEVKLANATALMMTAPLLIPFTAHLILGEELNRWLLTVPVIGFVGVAAILRPELQTGTGLTALIALLGSVSMAVAQTSIRKLSFTEPPLRIVFYFAFIGVIVSAIPLLWAWETPTSFRQWGLLVALGPVSVMTQVLLTRGYASAPASQVGIFIYSSVIFSAIAGWQIWDEVWDLQSFLGALLIAIAGVLVIRGQARTGSSGNEAAFK